MDSTPSISLTANPTRVHTHTRALTRAYTIQATDRPTYVSFIVFHSLTSVSSTSTHFWHLTHRIDQVSLLPWPVTSHPSRRILRGSPVFTFTSKVNPENYQRIEVTSNKDLSTPKCQLSIKEKRLKTKRDA